MIGTNHFFHLGRPMAPTLGSTHCIVVPSPNPTLADSLIFPWNHDDIAVTVDELMSFGKYQIVMMNRGKPTATLALASTPSPNLSNCPGLHLSLYLCLCSTPPDHICLSFYLVLCSLTHNTNIRWFSICHQSVG